MSSQISSSGGLPYELWEKTILILPFSAILKLRLTSGFTTGVINDSNPIKRKMFSSVGLKCPNEPPSVADFLRIALPYVNRINMSHSEVIKNDLPFAFQGIEDSVAGGVYGFRDGTVLKLFAPGSAKDCDQWEIAAPIDDGENAEASYFCICPSANVAAFAQPTSDDARIGIYVVNLRNPQTGVIRTIKYSDASGSNSVFGISITASRLAVLMSAGSNTVHHLVVWDWQESEAIPVELPVGENSTMGFIDDSKLLYTLDATDDKPAMLVMIDTSTSDSMATSFLLPEEAGESIRLVLEKDVHIQTPMAPFRDDPNQRLIVLDADCGRFLIFRVGALLERHNAGEDKIAWDMWREDVATPPNRKHSRPKEAWVSGCRLFETFYDTQRRAMVMRVYDFSEWGQERHLESEINPQLGVRYLNYTEEKGYRRSYNFVGGTRGSLMVFTRDKMEIWKLGVKNTSVTTQAMTRSSRE